MAGCAAIDPLERFHQSYIIDPMSGCWVWQRHRSGTKSIYGYFREVTYVKREYDADGNMTRGHAKEEVAHRWIYKRLIGPIPDGMELDHVRFRDGSPLCTTTLCVNPAHLEPVDPDENSRRARLSVCRSGRHDLTDPANVQWDKQGRRRGCAVCPREAAIARRGG